MHKYKIGFTLFVVLLSAYFNNAQEIAQLATATPARISIMTSTPLATQIALASATPTWTATAEGPIQLEVNADQGEVNVRSEPDPNSQRLGAIQAGTRYVVRGRYFSWYWFDFPASPTGTGWVYGDLVTIIGNEALITDVDPYADPTTVAQAEASATFAVLALTPGADLTVAADSRVLVIPTPTLDVNAIAVPDNGLLPTYTPPSEFNPRITATSVGDGQSGVFLNTLNSVSASGLPPIIPIVGLFGLGILGIVVSVLRRSG